MRLYIYHHRQMLALTKSQLYKEISKQETAHPEATLLVAGDFNAGKLKSVLSTC